MTTTCQHRGFLPVLLLVTALAAPAAAFDNLYVVGDSLSDQGNLFVATTIILGPDRAFPASDHYFDGRFSNGGNYVDYLAERLGAAAGPSLLNGNNFADGGARTDYNTVEDDTSKPFPVNFLCQNGHLTPQGCDYGTPPFLGFPEDLFPWTLNGEVGAFTQRLTTNPASIDPDGLYIVFAGANDLSDLTAVVATCASVPIFCIDPGPVIQGVVQGIGNTIAAFVAAGAQDIIVPNAPDLGVVPGVTRFGPDFAALATGLTAAYNGALQQMLSQWQGITNIIPFDTFSLLDQVVADPAVFGFANASEACYTGFVGPAGPGDTVCADPDRYVFWDREHPTTALHAVLADLMVAAAARDILDDLVQRVASLNIAVGTRSSLVAELAAVERALADPDGAEARAAAKAVSAFIHTVEARAGRGIVAEDAAMLVDRAQRLSSLLPG